MVFRTTPESDVRHVVRHFGVSAEWHRPSDTKIIVNTFDDTRRGVCLKNMTVALIQHRHGAISCFWKLWADRSAISRYRDDRSAGYAKIICIRSLFESWKVSYELRKVSYVGVFAPWAKTLCWCRTNQPTLSYMTLFQWHDRWVFTISFLCRTNGNISIDQKVSYTTLFRCRTKNHEHTLILDVYRYYSQINPGISFDLWE